MEELKNLIRRLGESGETIVGFKSVPTEIRGISTLKIYTFCSSYTAYSHPTADSWRAEAAVVVALQDYYDQRG